jgi:hypothetical protein
LHYFWFVFKNLDISQNPVVSLRKIIISFFSIFFVSFTCWYMGSLSYHTYCDMGPRIFRSHPTDRPIQSPLATRKGMRRTYS